MPLNTLKKSLRSPPVQLFLFCLAAVLLFAPIVSKSFASDDFLVMKRVALDRVLWIKGFFRPLSDITLFFNYLIGGFDPKGYYIFNILVHGMNSFLLFRFCLLWKRGSGLVADRMRGGETKEGIRRSAAKEWTGGVAGTGQMVYSLIAAVLFLTYPYHSEGIAWVLGRASIVASLMGISALLILVSDLSMGVRVAAVCLCYFIGLAAYESIMVLPLMILVILYGRQTPSRVYRYWGMALGFTLILHLVIRVLVSGGVLGSYGETFFGRRLLNYAGNLFRVTGRLFLPPTDDTQQMILLFALLLVVLAAAFYLFFKRSRGDISGRSRFFKLLILLALASVIPALFGVSTRTSESDRFLYFPSFFWCCSMAFLLTYLLRSRSVLVFFLSVLVASQVIFLEKNNLNWLKASRMTRDIITTTERQDRIGRLFVINLPDEQDGAYIFRMGFDDALVIGGMDTTRVTVINHLTRDEMLLLPDSLRVERKEGQFFIAPSVMISRQGTDSLRLAVVGGMAEVDGRAEVGEHAAVSDTAIHWAGKGDVVLYWNRHRLMKLK